MKRLAYLILVFSFLLSYSYGRDFKRETWEYSFIRALNYEEKGELEKAILELEQAYQEKPKELLVLRELAYCYGKIGNLQKSKELYEKVLEFDPKDENALQNLELMKSLEKK